MKLKVEHLTLFEYDNPVYETATEIRLHPAGNHGAPQQLEAFSLEVEPTANVYSYTDYFGNQVHYFTLLQSHDKLSIQTTAIVHTGSGVTPSTELEEATMFD